MSDEARRAATEVGAAIDRAVGADMVVRWVAAIEVIDGQGGERGVWLLTPDGATPWDTLGLLGYALERERAAIIRDED